ncbi:MAG: PEGA domain-containing protein [Firmicutes bacterium]|nr:PEGA domain-containing protein [Bacillota bacterium]
MDKIDNAGSPLSQEELRRRQRESELEAEMEFAPLNHTDRIETGYVPPLDDSDAILPDSEFFEPDTDQIPQTAAHAAPQFTSVATSDRQDEAGTTAKTAVGSTPAAGPASTAGTVPPEGKAPAANTAPASSGAVPPRKPADSIDAMMTAQVPLEAIDGGDSRPVRKAQSAKKQQEPAVTDEEPNEPDNQDTGRPARIVLIIGIVLILLAVLAFLITMGLMKNRNRNNSSGEDSTISSREESQEISEVAETDASISGVILEMNSNTGVVFVYSAATKEKLEFNLMKADLLTDAHGNAIGYDALRIGDLVDVSYRTGAENKVRRLRLSSAGTNFKDVSGAVVDRNAGLIRINNKNYTYDSNLICQYQGEDLNPGSITDRYVFNGAALDGHLYRLTITHAEGTVEIKGIDDVEDGTRITFTPTVGKKVEAEITKNMAPVSLTEGFNRYVVERNGEILISGSVFINSGERTALTLNSVGKQSGEIELQIRPEDVDVTITLDGKKQNKKLISDVEYGEHELVITAEGYAEYKQTITLKQPYMPVSVNLEQTDVTVSVSASLKGTVVYCDGNYMGSYENKPVQFRLDPGTYELTLAHTGYELLNYTLIIESGSPSVDLYFSRFVPQVQYGQINLTIDPADLAVRIVMDNVQQSSTSIANVEYGEHEILVSADGYEDFTTKVKVDKDTVPVSVKMVKSTGDVTVTIEPSGAQAKVTLDGKSSGNGTFKNIEYGDHELEVSAAGYDTVTQTVKVDQKNVAVSVSLERNAGDVTVTVTPSSAKATITLDGTASAKGTFTNVPFGDHVVEVSAAGYATVTQTITVDEGKENVSVTLQQIGNITVTVEPAGATITLDEMVSETGSFNNIAYGEHVLVVSADGYETDTQMITLDKDSMTVKVTLKKITGTVYVEVDPAAKAAISLAGKSSADGVFSGLEYGTYDLLVTADGYEDYMDTVTVDEAEVSVKVTLKAIEKSQEESSEAESSVEESTPDESSAEDSSEAEESSEADNSSKQEESSEPEESSIPEESSESESSADESSAEGSKAEESNADSSTADESKEEASKAESTTPEG